MWSSAWSGAAARLLAVGVVTGALTAVVLVLGVTALEGGTLLDVGPGASRASGGLRPHDRGQVHGCRCDQQEPH